MSIIKVPEILLPQKNVDLKKWAVIACDQFTSQPDYWKRLEEYCGDISTLNITFPEIYLGNNQAERIKSINVNMAKYLNSGVFYAVNGFILTVRRTAFGRQRTGLILSFDLDQYDYNDKLQVRATEATVPERLPVRVKIRENACLELPHALLLINDKAKSVIEPLYANRDKLKLLYKTELNNNGGSVEGYLVENCQEIIDKIESLKTVNGDDFLLAVGDGNHSIATAKLCWENIKKNLSEKERKNHPARYCLCEVDNLYEDDLNFEPINRVVFGVGEEFITYLCSTLNGDSAIEMYYNGKKYTANVTSNSPQAITDIQKAIDDYISGKGYKQDYVHGFEHTKEVALKGNGVGIIMPKLKKEDLFGYISSGKILTRKSFSMGEAEEKRYYLECKKIKENI